MLSVEVLYAYHIGFFELDEQMGPFGFLSKFGMGSGEKREISVFIINPFFLGSVGSEAHM